MADVGRSRMCRAPLEAPHVRIERDDRAGAAPLLPRCPTRSGRRARPAAAARLHPRGDSATGFAAAALRRCHPNVYIVGPGPLTQHGRHCAALLACRPHPALSHLSSLARMESDEGARRRPRHDDQPERPRRLRGVTVHRVRRLHPADVTRIDDLPCTTLPRALLDSPRPSRATRWRRPSRPPTARAGSTSKRSSAAPSATRAAVASSPSCPSSPSTSPRPAPRRASSASSSSCCARRASRSPAATCSSSGQRVDCHWPADRFVVELDSKGFHKELGGPRARHGPRRQPPPHRHQHPARHPAAHAAGAPGARRRPPPATRSAAPRFGRFASQWPRPARPACSSGHRRAEPGEHRDLRAARRLHGAEAGVPRDRAGRPADQPRGLRAAGPRRRRLLDGQEGRASCRAATWTSTCAATRTSPSPAPSRTAS